MITLDRSSGLGMQMVVLLAVVLTMALFAQTAQAAVFRVQQGSGATVPDGQSWDTAYPTIQAAVDATTAGDEVWVAKGTYTGVGAEVVNLKAAVTLYGGFAGTEAARDQRNRTSNITVIDGEKTRRCIAVTPPAVVDGFQLRNGAGYQGGGMNWGTAIHCLFDANQAAEGGGLFGGSATDCIFSGNVAEVDGGEMCGGKAVNCVFSANTASNPGWKGDLRGDGGGLYHGYAVNCFFFGNLAAINGGGMCDGQADNCIFADNSANWGGGASMVIALNCTFNGNRLVDHPHCECQPPESQNPVCTCEPVPLPGHYGALYSGKAANCIIWDNGADAVSSDCLVTYSCLSEVMEGVGNFASDPLFVEAAAHDFRLQSTSPCIDTGTAQWAPDGWAPVTDILGALRPQGVGYDMGAYEMSFVTVPDVSGLPRAAALEPITAAQLYVRNETEEYDPTVPDDHIIRQTPLANTEVPPHSPVDLVISKGPEPIPVPEVTGQLRDAAAASITGAALTVGTVTQEYSATVPVGTVISQTPAAGTPALPATAVNLVVSRGVRPSVVPDVVGQAQAQAESAITGAGLTVAGMTRIFNSTVAAGNVVSQSPAAGSELPAGTGISIVVSLGGMPVVEGEVEPMDADTAREKLDAALATADTNNDGRLSFAEAVAVLPGLTQSVFDTLDGDGDGQLSSDELGVKADSGCAGCRGTKTKLFGDVFPVLFSLFGLAAVAGVKRW